MGLLVKSSNPQLDSLGHGHVGFYGLQEKEKSLGNTLQLSLACWWDSPKTTLAAWASPTGLGHGFCPFLGPAKTEEEKLLCTENSGKARLTSQELEYG